MNQQALQTTRSFSFLTQFSPVERILFATLIGTYLLLFWPSLSSMAGVWWRSDTFAHGMLVPFISAWLIWRDKHRLKNIPVSSSWLAVTALAVGGLVWLVGIATSISVLHQLAAVGMLITLVPALLGLRLSLALLFPLLYLLFMVPFGEELTPALQQITADITVQALRLSGIPVFINGLFIEIPTGRFEVAEACSGVRYLIASLAVGTLYAYLTYQKYSKRFIFIIAALLVPILANGIRAYGIVLIAHLSEMKYATGVDHLIYGWLFFGLVMGLMFWVGSYWRDPEPALESTPRGSTTASAASSHRLPVLAVTLILFALIGLANAQLHRTVAKPLLADYQIELNDWQPDEMTASDWQPYFIGADRTLLQHYHKGGQRVGFYIADYQSEAENKELINQINQINSADNWTVHSRSSGSIVLGSLALPLVITELRHLNGAKRRIWHGFEAYNQFSSSGIKVKLWQALNRLSGSPYLSSVYAVAVDYEQSLQADQLLTLFLQDNWRAIFNQRNAQSPTDTLREQP